MSSTDIYSRITPLLRTILRRPDLEVRADLTPTNTPEWDSLAHINLMVAIEDEFGVELTTADHMTMRSVGDVVQIIDRRLAKSG